jgi:hypothetical protein
LPFTSSGSGKVAHLGPFYDRSPLIEVLTIRIWTSRKKRCVGARTRAQCNRASPARLDWFKREDSEIQR